MNLCESMDGCGEVDVLSREFTRIYAKGDLGWIVFFIGVVKMIYGILVLRV